MDEFRSAIQQADQTVMSTPVLEAHLALQVFTMWPGKDSVTLKRIWCLYEIWTCVSLEVCRCFHRRGS